ncbi:hypothetical protein [Thauera sp. SDU_THAU2]|uniref:hypothetical protein n=1 Tax=Thauera sp. SDU_THAU2 TaxID=3136633 RepID=UPI0031204769
MYLFITCGQVDPEQRRAEHARQPVCSQRLAGAAFAAEQCAHARHRLRQARSQSVGEGLALAAACDQGVEAFEQFVG